MFPLSGSIPLQNGPLFAIISICSCCAFCRNTVFFFVCFFNNCRLTNVSLIQFEIKHFEQVARCLNQRKNTNGFGNNCLINVSLLTSAYVQSYFSKCNNRRMTFAHAGILSCNGLMSIWLHLKILIIPVP